MLSAQRKLEFTTVCLRQNLICFAFFPSLNYCKNDDSMRKPCIISEISSNGA